MNFLNINSVDFSDLKFSQIKKSSSRRFILAYYNKKPFALKLPSLRIPFDSKINQFGQLEINVSITNEDLVTKLKTLDEQMKTFAIDNEWYSDTDFDYACTLKESNNGNFAPTFKFKVPIDSETGDVKTEFYSLDKTKIDSVRSASDVVDLLKKGVHIQTAVECIGVWFNDNRFGLSWKAHQVRVISKQEHFNSSECEIISDDECEISDEDLLGE